MRQDANGMPVFERDPFLDRMEAEAARLPWTEVVVAGTGVDEIQRRTVILEDGRSVALGDRLPAEHSCYAPGGRLTVRILVGDHHSRLMDVIHPEPRIGRMALAAIARFCPRAADLVTHIRTNATIVEKLGQICIPSTDGSGEHDTDGMNIRIVDGIARTATKYRGVELLYDRITVMRTVPQTVAATLVGRPLGDLLDIGIPIPPQVTISGIEVFEGEGMFVAFDDPGVPIPASRCAIKGMVADELARGGISTQD